MSDSAKLVAAVLILAGLLLVGCESVPTTTGQTLNACDYDYSRLMHQGWLFYTQTPLEAGDPKGEPKEQQCVVLFRVDVTADMLAAQNDRGGNRIWPINGLVYRKDRDRPTDIHAYPLTLSHDMYLGERAVSARVEDVLSGSNGSNGKEPRELIIEDKNADGVVVQASIFAFQEKTDSEESFYQPLGWFTGNAGVKVEKDQVTVLDRWQPRDMARQWLTMRSQLAQRKIYVPRDAKSYHSLADGKDDLSRIINPQTVDLTTLVMPADPDLTTAEYPEKLVLAFYERATMTDTRKLDPLMDNEVQADYWKRDTKSYGCLVNPDLSQVFVQDIDINPSPGVPPHINNEDKTQVDTLVVTSLCRVKAGDKTVDQSVVIEWQVRWDWDFETRTRKWRIIKATVR
jgi:hypothetical protein